MGFLFFEQGVDAAHPAPFSHVPSNRYWSTGFDNATAWNFAFSNGFTLTTGKALALFAWAVHAGDVGVVPERTRAHRGRAARRPG